MIRLRKKTTPDKRLKNELILSPGLAAGKNLDLSASGGLLILDLSNRKLECV